MNKYLPRVGHRSAAVWLALALSLSGCAVFNKPEKPPAPVVESHSPASYQVAVQGPAAQRSLLLSYLDLVRFQNAPQTEGLSPIELDRLCSAAPAQARALLETQGFFNAQVTLAREAGSPERIILSVEPGTPTRVTEVQFSVTGALNEAASQPGAAQALVNSLRGSWQVRKGSVFTQTQWTGAKAELLNQARIAGYLAAHWEHTEAVVDAEKNQALIRLTLASGPLFHLGALNIQGLQRQQPSSVQRLAGFSAGAPYEERALLDFQERLQGSGLFDSVSVDIDPDPQHAEAAALLVRVRESRLQDAIASLGYSANTGPRVAVEHVHRRPFDLNLRSKLKLELGKEKRLFEGELSSHVTPGMYRNLMAAKVERLDAHAELVSNYSLRLGRLQETPAQDRSYFVETLHSHVENPVGQSHANASSINYHWTWRRVDSALLPTEGWVAQAQTAVGMSRGTAADSGPFGRAWGRLSWYKPVGKQWFASARVEAGEVFAKGSVGLPDALLFRAGGDDSVRGYGYRSLGPTGSAGLLKSGRVVWTGSIEMARPIFPDKPQYQGAVFIDAGQAADAWRGFGPVLGYGLGLRWRSPVGPLRVDLAWPETGGRARLHFSVGIAF